MEIVECAASSFPITAVLLAGGKSRRMGEDKGRLMIEGMPLWKKQLSTLASTGAREVVVSGPAEGAYAGCGLPILNDDMPGAGPLAGVATILRRAEFDFVVVLAIDLPRMPAEYLSELMREALRTGQGIVPRRGHRFEPLAAVYSRGCAALAEAQLRSSDRSMQRFAGAALNAGFIQERLVGPVEEHFFFNLNSPQDRNALARD